MNREPWQLGSRWQGKPFASVFTAEPGVIVARANQQVETICEQDLGLRLHAAGQVFEFSGECVYTSPGMARVVLEEIASALT